MGEAATEQQTEHQPQLEQPDAASSAPGNSQGAGAEQEAAASTSSSSRHESCTPYFDALYFCYSPVHQLKQYYVYGNVDDCTGYWRNWYNCLKQRTRFKDEVPVDPMKGKHPLWELRTPDQAREFWQQEFSHLNRYHPEGQQQAEAEEEHHAGKATLV